MPDRRYRYRVEIDSGQAAGEARRLVQIFQRELRQIQIVPGAGQGGAVVRAELQQQVSATRTAHTQMQQVARTTAVQQQQLARQVTATVVAFNQQQTAAVRAQLAQQTAAHRAAMQQQVATHRAALAAQAAAARSVSPVGGGMGGFVAGGLNRFAMGAIAPLAAGFTAQAAISGIVEADRAAASMRRTTIAALQLAGSQDNLTSLLNAYKTAVGGAVTEQEAMLRVTQLQAIGFADNAQELQRFATAARAASLATGNSIDYVVGQLQLAIANQSTMRLDQLGLGVSEVKARIDELSKTVPGLTEEMRYQEAVLGLLIEKFGSIATAGEGAATGLEQVGVALADLKLDIQTWVADIADLPMRRFAMQLGGGSQADIQGQLTTISQRDIAGSDLATRMLAIFARANTLQQRGVSMPNALLQRIEEMGRNYGNTGGVNAQAIAYFEQEAADIERVLALMTDGGIVLADSQQQAADAAAEVTRRFIELAGHAYLVNVRDGRIVGQPMGGPALQPLGPYLPGDPNYRPSGVPQTPFFGGPSDWLGKPGLSGEEREKHALEVRAEREREVSALRIAADRKVASEAERAWKSAASATERVFRDAANELISSLRSVPGLLGTSSVTQEQLDLAKMGVAQNFADDYLRRVEDEVFNKKDYPDVSLSRLAELAGIDQSLDPKAQVMLARQMWEDSSLFANPAALELINWSAVQDHQIRQERAKLGEQNILAHRGITPEGEITKGGLALLDSIRQGALEGLPDFAADFSRQFSSALNSPASLNALDSAGSTIGVRLGDSIIGGVLASDPGSNLVNTIVFEVLRILGEEEDRP